MKTRMRYLWCSGTEHFITGVRNQQQFREGVVSVNKAPQPIEQCHDLNLCFIRVHDILHLSNPIIFGKADPEDVVRC